MKLLLDGHAYLWWLGDDASLSPSARSAIADPSNMVFVSAATVWEMEIKRRLGRLDARDADLADEIVANRFVELPVGARHARAAAALPRLHDDPFDRMLVAQCALEGMVCVTRDRVFERYGAACLW